MSDEKYYLDSLGCPRANFGEEKYIIGSFLEDDIQSGLYVCDEYIEMCKKAKINPDTEIRSSGNAHLVVFLNNNVLVENLFLEKNNKCTVSLEEFSNILNEWKIFISGDCN